ncbi:MAG: methyltransferase domain-containing protein, partial [Blastocatellia bacterium]
FGVRGLFVADVQRLDKLSWTDRFDVILFGDLIEHLSCPGLALDGIRRFMTDQSELIISTPNAFALLANARYSLGRYREGAEHVAAYSKFTLPTLLERHDLKLMELFTCYDRPPESGKVRFALGVRCFKMVPERGGTLLAVARSAN